MTYNFLPPENTAMSNLLELLSDPKKAKSRLDELSKQQADLNSKIEESKVVETSTKAAHAAAEKAKKEAEDLRKQNEETTSGLHKHLKDKIDHYDKALREHQDISSKQISDLSKQREHLSDREATVSSREIHANQLSDSVSKREAAVSKREKEVEAKLAKLKEIL